MSAKGFARRATKARRAECAKGRRAACCFSLMAAVVLVIPALECAAQPPEGRRCELKHLEPLLEQLLANDRATILSSVQGPLVALSLGSLDAGDWGGRFFNRSNEQGGHLLLEMYVLGRALSSQDLEALANDMNGLAQTRAVLSRSCEILMFAGAPEKSRTMLSLLESQENSINKNARINMARSAIRIGLDAEARTVLQPLRRIEDAGSLDVEEWVAEYRTLHSEGLANRKLLAGLPERWGDYFLPVLGGDECAAIVHQRELFISGIDAVRRADTQMANKIAADLLGSRQLTTGKSCCCPAVAVFLYAYADDRDGVARAIEQLRESECLKRPQYASIAVAGLMWIGEVDLAVRELERLPMLQPAMVFGEIGVTRLDCEKFGSAVDRITDAAVKAGAIAAAVLRLKGISP